MVDVESDGIHVGVVIIMIFRIILLYFFRHFSWIT